MDEYNSLYPKISQNGNVEDNFVYKYQNIYLIWNKNMTNSQEIQTSMEYINLMQCSWWIIICCTQWIGYSYVSLQVLDCLLEFH